MKLDPVVLRGEGLVLREWSEDDLVRMPALFDNPEAVRWTPLETPFDLAAARRYLDKARATRAERRGIQLAITVDGGEPLGEVLMFRLEGDATLEMGYSIGPAHRGAGLAARATKLVADEVAARWGVRRFRLMIAPDNAASRRTATAAGAQLSPVALVTRTGPRGAVHLETWEICF
jgi:RimJ/RimL family protein N-acetyltransferase